MTDFVSSDVQNTLTQIRLVVEGEALLVAPPSDQPEAFEPFALPPLKRSLLEWMVSYALSFRIQFNRCAGLVLLLDPIERRWSWACPWQRASRDSASWSNLSIPLPPSQRLIAGTFQTRILTSGEAVQDCAPSTDGLHCVCQLHPGTAEVICLLRTQPTILIAAPSRVLVDDYALAVQRCAAQFSLL